MIHEALAEDSDPTLSGVTVILPHGPSIYLSAAEARKPPPRKRS
jgi:hypothetical protein